MSSVHQALTWVFLIGIRFCHGITLDISSRESICAATDIIQNDIMDYYWGSEYGGVVGMFVYPYYWWEAGLVFGGMLENWYLCDNTKYEQLLHDCLIAQSGTNYDFIPSNQSLTEGNDDQGIWGLFVMDVVERNFPDATEEGVPGWLAMIQAVYNTMWLRWDTEHCGGGLRWQIFAYNIGYDYKNSIANGCLFLIAARLGRYTGQQEYLDTAEKVFQWLVDINFFQFNDPILIMDGAHVTNNCTALKGPQWSYNHGIILAGCAVMYNVTGSEVWRERVDKILQSAKYFFFFQDVMYESACQGSKIGCNNDQRAFKSVLSRMLALTSVLAPFTRDQIMPLLQASATSAAASCAGGPSGSYCGLDWHRAEFDGIYGLGEQISALDVIQSLLIHTKPAPHTANEGGSSKGDPEAGKNYTTSSSVLVFEDAPIIEQNERIIAASITAGVLGMILGTGIWMMF
ncbi:HDL503Cp [Eremothecium sinecaudum]|uniref:Mannan endo-1,6-alpha-mannosidase n=1 Tax=Eremothecium sinecaudum TaxID=45286 RepID=A0A0X8HRS2_9SACH|nr:HDL503Cp [Eremothecium sinecaudum]AMD20241.1 HDL503Cp [Eremothecium sinecaudum]